MSATPDTAHSAPVVVRRTTKADARVATSPPPAGAARKPEATPEASSPDTTPRLRRRRVGSDNNGGRRKLALPPRFAKAHVDSDSDPCWSDGATSPTDSGRGRVWTLYRALRPDEVTRPADGDWLSARLAGDGVIRTRADAVAKPPGAHVQAGTRATKHPSTWVSFTKSRKVAALWAAHAAADRGHDGGFVVEVRVAPRPPAEAAAWVTVSRVEHAGATLSDVAFPALVDFTAPARTSSEPSPAADPATDGGDREELSGAVTPASRCGRVPLTKGLGVLGAAAARSSREVLLGRTNPGEIVVDAANISRLGFVRFLREDETPPDAAETVQGRVKAGDAAVRRCAISWLARPSSSTSDPSELAVAELAEGLQSIKL